jgi:hypothetical protein
MNQYKGLNDSQATALDQLAKEIAVPGIWLWEVINFESRHNPAAKNPGSSARGLIQFMDSTAKSLGYASSEDLVNKNPSYEDQIMGPVKKYFTVLNHGPYPSRQSLYMTIFFPAARNVPPDTTFQSLYEKIWPADGLSRYAKFSEQNPGIATVNDYVSKTLKNAMSKLPIATIEKTAGGLGILALAAIVVYAIARKKYFA